MSDAKYEYEVAFSFVAQDEGLATELSDLLQERFSTFLYSKRQEQLAGTDGEESFARVFSKDARVVVVLYRDDWGKTPWTRIEETAIRNRAFEEGYDFTVFIPLAGAGVPRWVPKTRLWVGLDRWGANGAASIIEARIQDQGGTTTVETVEERALRLQRTLQFREERAAFLRSQEGVQRASSEFEMLGRELEEHIRTIQSATGSLKYSTKMAQSTIAVLGRHAGMAIDWNIYFANNLDDAQLEVALYKGHPPFPGIMTFVEPKRHKLIRFEFDLLAPERPGWCLKGTEPREFETKQLAEYLIKWFMDDADHVR